MLWSDGETPVACAVAGGQQVMVGAAERHAARRVRGAMARRGHSRHGMSSGLLNECDVA